MGDIWVYDVRTCTLGVLAPVDGRESAGRGTADDLALAGRECDPAFVISWRPARRAEPGNGPESLGCLDVPCGTANPHAVCWPGLATVFFRALGEETWRRHKDAIEQRLEGRTQHNPEFRRRPALEHVRSNAPCRQLYEG